MIDPYSGNHIAFQKFEQKIMSRVKHVLIFNTNRDNFGHSEKAAIIDLVRAHSPESKSLMLPLNDLVVLLVIPINRRKRTSVQFGDRFRTERKSLLEVAESDLVLDF